MTVWYPAPMIRAPKGGPFRLDYSRLNFGALLDASSYFQLDVSELDSGTLDTVTIPMTWQALIAQVMTITISVGLDRDSLEQKSRAGTATIVVKDAVDPRQWAGWVPGVQLKIPILAYNPDKGFDLAAPTQGALLFNGQIQNIRIDTDRDGQHYRATITCVDVVWRLQNMPEMPLPRRDADYLAPASDHVTDLQSAAALPVWGNRPRWNPPLENHNHKATPADHLDLIATSTLSRWFPILNATGFLVGGIGIIDKPVSEVNGTYSDVDNTRLLDVSTRFDTGAIINNLNVKTWTWDADKTKDQQTITNYRSATSEATYGPRRAEIDVVTNIGHTNTLGETLVSYSPDFRPVIDSITVDDYLANPHLLGDNLQITYRGDTSVMQIIGMDHTITTTRDKTRWITCRTTYHLRTPASITDPRPSTGEADSSSAGLVDVGTWDDNLTGRSVGDLDG